MEKGSDKSLTIDLARWLENVIQSQYDYAETKGTFVILCTTLLINALILLSPSLFERDAKEILHNYWQLPLWTSIPFLFSLFCITASLFFGLLSVQVHKDIVKKEIKTAANYKNLFFFREISRIGNAKKFIAIFSETTEQTAIEQILTGIWHQSEFLTKKFKYLSVSVSLALFSIGFFVFALILKLTIY